MGGLYDFFFMQTLIVFDKYILVKRLLFYLSKPMNRFCRLHCTWI